MIENKFYKIAIDNTNNDKPDSNYDIFYKWWNQLLPN